MGTSRLAEGQIQQYIDRGVGKTTKEPELSQLLHELYKAYTPDPMSFESSDPKNLSKHKVPVAFSAIETYFENNPKPHENFDFENDFKKKFTDLNGKTLDFESRRKIRQRLFDMTQYISYGGDVTSLMEIGEVADQIPENDLNKIREEISDAKERRSREKANAMA